MESKSSVLQLLIFVSPSQQSPTLSVSRWFWYTLPPLTLRGLGIVNFNYIYSLKQDLSFMWPGFIIIADM